MVYCLGDSVLVIQGLRLKGSGRLGFGVLRFRV